MRRLLLLGPLLAIAAVSTSFAAAPRTYAYLACGSQDSYSVSSRPRDCFLDWPNLSLAEAVNVRHITWDTWGGPTARGAAVTRTKVFDPWTRVRIVAAGRRSCGDSRAARTFVYTRVRVDFGSAGAHTWRTPGCSVAHADD